ncbi:MFS transporter [Mycobacterium montefiorense]|uniref:MFS transporter n=1 Tax=Mycobacterium montefiorense TaxID=154654 RepID=UPI0021DEE688|nr:MFS transporter [Mycobacterium montefiorense]MCV7429321.1 MFS transporter [Mycobacterium montefiorense]GLE53600.1 MFS transporter [Mycobacterium montefiorense]
MRSARESLIEKDIEGVNWRMVAVAGAMSFVAMADGNVATVVVPSVMKAFDTSTAVASFILLGYQIPVAALLLFFGSLFASISMRIAVPVTIILFTVSGALCAVADTMSWLVAARVAQGVCASALLVQMPLLAATAAPPAFLGRAMSVPVISGPLGGAVGAGVAGFLVAHFDYRSVFLLHVPVCVLALVLFAAASTRPPDPGHTTTPTFCWRRESTGAVISAAGIALLLFAIGGFARGWSMVVAAVAGGALLVVWVKAFGRSQTTVLRHTATKSIHVAIALLALGFVVLTYTVSVTMQDAANHIDPAGTGAALMAFPLTMAVFGLIGGKLADRLSATTVACAGGVVVGVAALLFLDMPSGWTPMQTGWRLAIAGVGMGLYGAPTQALLFSRAHTTAERAILSGSSQLARNVGFTAGPACAVGAMHLVAPLAPVLLGGTAAFAGTVALAASRQRGNQTACAR